MKEKNKNFIKPLILYYAISIGKVKKYEKITNL